MLVSWEWLSDYVNLTIDHKDMANRWALTGLNHESTEIIEGVPVIDLEITSNRGDCLGHIGIAREASVLLNQNLKIPTSVPRESSTRIDGELTIENHFREACPRYIGRVIRGVTISPSPEWMQKRLRSIGVKSINNVVDATNYVMFECGQPLHAFDLAHVRGSQIIIRPARPKEEFVAIDHRTYSLDTGMVVIADAERAIALGGVMGGVDSEVTDKTVDVLLEAADFVPLSIRRTARKLKLHSPSSYRYERKIDQAQLDWASRRCCELILELAGGELLAGSVDTGAYHSKPAALSLRRAKVRNVLGIDIPWEESMSILNRLGCEVIGDKSSESAQVTPPSYRMDLTREIDLIEEIARIHGYDRIPENAVVPMVASSRRPQDVMISTVRNVCCGFGFDETMTPSLIGKGPTSVISPWTDSEPMKTLVPLLEGASLLRRSLIPSLLAARVYNQQQSNKGVRLFETSSVYLPTDGMLPIEQFNLGLLGDADLRVVLGALEETIARVSGEGFLGEQVVREPTDWSYLNPGTGLVLKHQGKMLGWIGQISKSIADSIKLDTHVAIGELNLRLLLESAREVPRLQPIVPFPIVERDLNLIVNEALTWQKLSEVVRESAGPLCIGLQFREVYRDKKKDGADKKRMLFSLKLQSPNETLTSDQADEVTARVLSACKKDLQATLLA